MLKTCGTVTAISKGDKKVEVYLVEANNDWRLMDHTKAMMNSGRV